MRQFFLVILCAAFATPTVGAGVSVNQKPIVETHNPKGWIMQTQSSAYWIVVTPEGAVKPIYYGPAGVADQAKEIVPHQLEPAPLHEVPVRGGVPDKTPMLEMVFADNGRDCDLTFVRGDIIEQQGRKVLKIVQKDRYYPLEVTSFIRVLPEYDLLEKWVGVRNTGPKDPIRIENLQSASLNLPPDAYRLTHLGGVWAHEFTPFTTELTPGLKTLQSKDFKSFTTPAWYMLQPKQTRQGGYDPTWFGMLTYSGNWKIDFDMAYNGRLQIVGGINFWDTWWNLKPGETFQTPVFISGFTTKGADAATLALQAYTRKTVLPVAHRDKLRPILYNSWYATEFNVKESNQLMLAKVAKDIGVEYFVIDDGWFKGRLNDKGGLGDWTVDKTKFPDGLQPMIQQINKLGLEVGIWVEPEMINPNSDLYRTHPDWVLQFPHRPKTEFRNQLVLNLARDDVYQYLLTSFTNLLKDNNLKFIKWDHNRPLAETGWSDAPSDTQREVRIRYMQNLYRLIDTLRSRFPDVWFENCSAGGGRPDLGMLARTDQIWVSDNTDPADRLFIQYGYLSAFPANTMVCWTTDTMNPLNLPLDFSFDVAMSGVLGVGNDLTKWTDKEIAIAKEKIARYKQIRPLVQQGTAYRLESPYDGYRSALQYTAADSASAVLFCYNLGGYPNESPATITSAKRLILKGLRPDKRYQIGTQKEAYRGDYLMQIGIDWPVNGGYKSALLDIKQLGD